MSISKFLVSKIFFINLSLMVTLISLMVLAIFEYTKIITYHSQTVKIPDIHLLRLDDAIKELEKLELKYKIIDSSAYDPKFKEKIVLLNSPQSNEIVKKYRSVYLTVNKMILEKVMLPNIIGKSKRKVMYLLNINDIKVNNMTYIYGNEKDILHNISYNGEIISSDTNIYISKNSSINLTFTNGLRENEVYLPNLYDMNLIKAKNTIKRLNLKLININYTHTIDSSKAIVIKQHPLYFKDKKVLKFSEISLWLSDLNVDDN